MKLAVYGKRVLAMSDDIREAANLFEGSLPASPVGISLAFDTVQPARLQEMVTLCEELELETTLPQVKFLADAVKRRDLRDISAHLAQVPKHLRYDLESRLLAAIPKSKALYFEASFGAEVGQAFPSAALDIREANSCYASNRNTAALFHSMRVVEIALRALAKERHIKLSARGPIAWQEWQQLVTDIRQQVSNDGKNITKGALKDAFLEFYGGALREFEGFKDEFRNYVMHTRPNKTYDELDAERVLRDTKHFMLRLSKRLTESGKRIRWR
jgi:hypothetical protein